MRNLKRALSLGLTAAMISGLMVMGSSAASSSYTDVADTNNVEAIEVLKAVGIMVGDESGDFNPDQKVTRNEMAVVMSNLMAYNVATYANTSPFTDVPSWAEPYVAACWTNGITAGTSATTYGGSESVTTAQAALMLMKALGYFQYASDFGSDWQLSTVSQGNRIDLFEDVDSGVREALSLSEEWSTVSDGELAMGCIVARTDYIEENPQGVEAFLSAYEDSIAYMSDPDNLEDAAELVAQYNITANANIAKAAIPQCNLVCLTGDEMKSVLEAYYQVLFDADPTSIGGALPDASFYYGAQ